MQVKIFNTRYSVDPIELNQFLAQDGKTISVQRLHTACAGTGAGTVHFVTVEYYDQASPIQPARPLEPLVKVEE
jgi:hypothetical protein